MADNFYTKNTKIEYLTPTAENMVGYISDEIVKQLSGFQRSGVMRTELPSMRDMATSVVFSASPIKIQVTIERFEPQGISFVIDTENDGQ